MVRTKRIRTAAPPQKGGGRFMDWLARMQLRKDYYKKHPEQHPLYKSIQYLKKKAQSGKGKKKRMNKRKKVNKKSRKSIRKRRR